MSYEPENLKSADKKVRSNEYSNVKKIDDLKDKISIFKEGINDPHDTIRSNIIEYLCEIYENGYQFDLTNILITRLQIENFWIVKYLILKKLLKFGSNNNSDNIEMILPHLKGIKPQIRLVSVEILCALEPSKISDSIATELLQTWQNEKDNDTRLKLTQLLNESKHSIIESKLSDYRKKVAEKEKRKKDIAGMFEGI